MKLLFLSAALLIFISVNAQNKLDTAALKKIVPQLLEKNQREQYYPEQMPNAFIAPKNSTLNNSFDTLNTKTSQGFGMLRSRLDGMIVLTPQQTDIDHMPAKAFPLVPNKYIPNTYILRPHKN
jgi:hypothetical protein